MSRRARGKSSGGVTLVELSLAAPITLCVAGLAVAVVLSAWTRLARAALAPELAAVPRLERLRREIREARAVLYPRAGPRDVAAQCLLLRARDGTLVGWAVDGGALTRTTFRGPPRVELPGFTRLAVRRLGGKQPVVRIGLARAGAAPLLLSAAPLNPEGGETP